MPNLYSACRACWEVACLLSCILWYQINSRGQLFSKSLTLWKAATAVFRLLCPLGCSLLRGSLLPAWQETRLYIDHLYEGLNPQSATTVCGADSTVAVSSVESKSWTQYKNIHSNILKVNSCLSLASRKKNPDNRKNCCKLHKMAIQTSKKMINDSNNFVFLINDSIF